MVVNKELEQKIRTQLQLHNFELLQYIKAHPEGVLDKQLVAEFTRRGWVESVIRGCLTELLATRRLVRTRWRLFVPLYDELLNILQDRQYYTLEELYRKFPQHHFECVRKSLQVLAEQQKLGMDQRGKLRLRSVI